MAQRIFFACLLVFLTGGAGTTAHAACSPVELLQFYSAAAKSNFSAIDGGDNGAGALTDESRSRALKANAPCPRTVFFEDVPAKAGDNAYRIVYFDGTYDSTSDDWPVEIVDQFMPVLAKQNFAKPSAKQEGDGMSVTWKGPDKRWVVVSFSEHAGRKGFSVRIYRDY